MMWKGNRDTSLV